MLRPYGMDFLSECSVLSLKGLDLFRVRAEQADLVAVRAELLICR